MDNLKIYNIARKVPNEAKKPINAGRLKGMTDINPMYRIKRLTELFGPCGVGWWYDIVDKQMVTDELTKQVAAFVDILLYYKDPETGEASRGIPGTGGASFVAQERNGPYMSDECYKMALTDAISVAAKSLGIGADVYWDKDRTKYSVAEEPGGSKPKQSSGNEGQSYETPVTCENCKTEILAYENKGKTISAAKHAAGSKEKFNKVLCLKCIERERRIRQAEQLAGEGQ